MKIKLENIGKDQRLLANVNGLIANHYENYLRNLKLGMSQTLDLDIEYIDSLLNDIDENKPKMSQHQDMIQTVHDAIQGDICLQQIESWRDSMIPASISPVYFKNYAEYIHDIEFNYMINEWHNINETNSNYELFKMIRLNQLDDFFDRFFTKEEGAVCSHDKTVFVQKQLLKAITTDQTLPLTEYFENSGHPELDGKETYWSTKTFETTDELITFLNERFYL